LYYNKQILNFSHSITTDKERNKVRRLLMNSFEKLKMQTFEKGILCNKMELKKRKEFSAGLREIVSCLNRFSFLCPQLKEPLNELVINAIVS
jgi:hypothetical protein